MEKEKSIYFIYKHGKATPSSREEPRKVLVSQEEWEQDWLNWWNALEKQKKQAD